jgi:hypothetical protein
MRFLYFYSPLYQFYHEHIQETIGEFFELEHTLIEDIKELDNKDQHHFIGLTIKLDIIIDAIKRYMGETIIFSDATIFINKNKSHELKDYFLGYSENDITFIFEEGNGENIGVMQIKCSEKTLEFFIMALDNMIKGGEVHDQSAIKYVIFYHYEDIQLKMGYFGERIVCDVFHHYKKDDFLIYKSFISNRNKTSNFNQRIQKFYDLGLIDYDTYNKWTIKNENQEVILY